MNEIWLNHMDRIDDLKGEVFPGYNKNITFSVRLRDDELKRCHRNTNYPIEISKDLSKITLAMIKAWVFFFRTNKISSILKWINNTWLDPDYEVFTTRRHALGEYQR